MAQELAKLLKTTLWEAYTQPTLTRLGLYEQLDLSYGRSDVPFSPMERRLYACDDVDVWFGKVMLENGKDWCWYQVWQKKQRMSTSSSSSSSEVSCQRSPDILFVHGTGVHSGTLAGHARRYLDAGFRLIVPDLVSHGYSSGVHVYQRHMRQYTHGLHAVLHDVARRDDAAAGINTDVVSRSNHQETFMLGLSFGGTVALHYAVDYPSSKRESQDVEQGKEIPIDGIVVVGPILGYSTHNIVMTNYIAYAVLALDAIGAGCMELYVPHKKCLDKDPKVYKTLIDEDKRSHQGAFRVGHMLCINDAVVRLHGMAHTIEHALFIQQGGQDRVACPSKTYDWIQRVPSKDKRMTIYPVCQHVVYRKAKTQEEDDAGRVVCIEDNVDWMLARVKRSTRRRKNTIVNGSHRLQHFSRTSITSSSDDQSMSSGASTPYLSDESYGTDLTTDEEESGDETEHPKSTIRPNGKFITIKPEDELYDHPLLARAHSTTLPALAKLCPERVYRSHWLLSNSLRPFDVNTIPNWSAEERKEKHLEAIKYDPWSSFTRR